MSAGRRLPSTPDGAHFLLPSLARRLVAESGVRPGELVLDLGAGTGVITAALLDAKARVVAVERDPKAVRRLQRRFGSAVRVISGDLREIPLPRRPYRVVANIPFGVTTALLRRLLDSPLQAADLVVADGVARALSAARPANPRTLRWATRYRLDRGRRLPAGCFRPPPSVDAAVLVVRRRPRDLMTSAAHRSAFHALLDAAYGRPDLPWELAVRGLVTRRQAARIAAERELAPGTPASRLSAVDWLAAARAMARD